MTYVNIYDYFNYREYLEDYYEVRKGEDSYFSYRSFAQRAGYNSSGLYSLITSGVRKLTPRYLKGFSKALGLNEQESKYFYLMVRFTHAKTERMKKEYFIELVGCLPQSERKLKLHHKEFYSKWYYVVIHQALGVLNIGDDNKGSLKEYIRPQLGMREINKSLVILRELRLIKKNSVGYWKATSSNLSGGKEVGRLYINQFQKTMLDLAKDSYDNFPVEDRYTITESYAISASKALEIRERTELFHKEIISLIVNDQEKEEEIYQMNLQLFPLFKKNNEGGK